ncbi:MAG: YceD family protein [Leptolyngbyaceae cyanobacterium bins.59]|nr:YceD family protein [Leptolyngbyaceae cyanobacterium bins.59]
MEQIYIPQLTRAPEQTIEQQFEEFLPDLETLTPVKGVIRVKHQGSYLEVKAKAEAIITLDCDRCLQNYNHRLTLNVSELIWLTDVDQEMTVEDLEVEVPFESLVETLPSQGYLNTGDWLYQQLCLAIPQRKLCDNECKGIQPPLEEGSPVLLDRRWASLEALKQRYSP